MWEVPEDIKPTLRLGSDRNVQHLLDRVVEHLTRVQRPDYVGHILLNAGVTLRQLLLLVDILVHNGAIRKASSDEAMKHFGTWTNEAIYTLVRNGRSS